MSQPTTISLYCPTCAEATSFARHRLIGLARAYCLCGTAYDLDPVRQSFWTGAPHDSFTYTIPAGPFRLSDRINITCRARNHTFCHQAGKHLQRRTCPYCARTNMISENATSGEKLTATALTLQELTYVSEMRPPLWDMGRNRIDFLVELPKRTGRTKLAIEYDGSQHFKAGAFRRSPGDDEEARFTDVRKTCELIKLGYQVLRIDYQITDAFAISAFIGQVIEMDEPLVVTSAALYGEHIRAVEQRLGRRVGRSLIPVEGKEGKGAKVRTRTFKEIMEEKAKARGKGGQHREFNLKAQAAEAEADRKLAARMDALISDVELGAQVVEAKGESKQHREFNLKTKTDQPTCAYVLRAGPRRGRCCLQDRVPNLTMCVKHRLQQLWGTCIHIDKNGVGCGRPATHDSDGKPSKEYARRCPDHVAR